MSNETKPEQTPGVKTPDFTIGPPQFAPIKIVEHALPSHFTKAVLTVATNAWKLRSRLIDLKSGEPREDLKKEDVRKLSRHIDAIFEAFGQIELEVKDRTGEPFDYGLPEKVVTTQPQPGLKKEQIIETLRPSIYWNKQLAQQGEVVIATPA
jgi:hypothetical protein